MRVALALALSSLLFAAGCRSKAPDQAATGPAVAASGSATPPPSTFGAPITAAAKAESLAGLLAAPDGFAGRTVVVEGHVRRACTRKGCWMELATAPDKDAAGCRVTFKDYGFFVPKDSAGATARVEAAVELARLEPAHVAHLEREGAHFSAKDPDGGAREVRLVANGVELRR